MNTNGKIKAVKLPKFDRITRNRVAAVLAQIERLDLKSISMLRHYPRPGRNCGCGVGFVNIGTAAEKLVEFEYNTTVLNTEEITLAKSVAWIRESQSSEIRFGLECAERDDEAEMRWYEMLELVIA